jgi:hypothetical protein
MRVGTDSGAVLLRVLAKARQRVHQLSVLANTTSSSGNSSGDSRSYSSIVTVSGKSPL